MSFENRRVFCGIAAVDSVVYLCTLFGICDLHLDGTVKLIGRKELGFWEDPLYLDCFDLTHSISGSVVFSKL